VSAELNGANLTENACKLILNNGVSKEFVYYFTKSNSFIEQTGINTRVAAQPKLALNRLKTMSIPLPPLPEQKRIVAILDEAFAGISLAVANAEKNLANARELFESVLQSAIEGKFSQELLSEVVQGNQLVDTSDDIPLIVEKEIPFPLPVTWQWKRLGSIAKFINGDRGKNYPNKKKRVVYPKIQLF